MHSKIKKGDFKIINNYYILLFGYALICSNEIHINCPRSRHVSISLKLCQGTSERYIREGLQQNKG